MIHEGDLVFLNFLDIGGEVDLKALVPELETYGKVWIEHFPGASWIEDGVRILTKDGVYIAGQKVYPQIKIFSIGGILIRINVPVKDKDFHQIRSLIIQAESEVIPGGKEPVAMTFFAKQLAGKIKSDINHLISSPYSGIGYEERYRVIIVKKAEMEIIEKSEREIAGLIRKESFERLSAEEIEEISGNTYSYRDNFIRADLRGAFAFVKNNEIFPVMRAIELYLLQRIELRVYDSLLDEMLDKAYGILEKAESKADRDLGQRINDIHLMRLELFDIVSAMRGIKANPKARIFSLLCETIAEVLEVEDLVDSVSRKLERLREIYTMVYDALQSTRLLRMDKTMVMLEAVIVILIVIEIVLALLGL